MRTRCSRTFGRRRHASLAEQCDYCQSPAAFHWITTYPDVMLCQACLEMYPEAQELLVLCQHRRITDLQRDDSTYCLDCHTTFVADG